MLEQGDNPIGASILPVETVAKWESALQRASLNELRKLVVGLQLPPRQLLTEWTVAEQAAVQWLRYLGHRDAKQAPPGADGGLDVTASNASAQVKAYFKGLIPSYLLQQLVGAATGRPGRLYFFTSTGYSAPAVQYANRVEMALFTFDMVCQVKGANPIGVALLRVRREQALLAERHFTIGRTHLEPRLRSVGPARCEASDHAAVGAKRPTMPLSARRPQTEPFGRYLGPSTSVMQSRVTR